MTLYYTAYLVNNWRGVLRYQFDLAKQSGLLDELDELKIFAYPKNDEVFQVIEEFNVADKTTVFFQESNRYEIPALEYMIANPDDICLYCHSKTTSRTANSPDLRNVTQWMEYMSFYILTNWRVCLNLLKDDRDAIGVDFKTKPFVHFSGNFWIATKKHIEKCKNFKFTMESIGDLKRLKYTIRHTAEMFIGSQNGVYVSMHQSECDWYKYIYPKDRWTINPIKFEIYRK